MVDVPPATFAGLRPRLKRRWLELLPALPSPSPLGHPDIVAYLLDDFLDLLEREVAASPPGDLPPAGPSFSACPCQMNPLLPCFIAGEQALIETGAPALGARLHDVLACYHRLANKELSALCGVCLYRENPGCAGRTAPAA